MAVPHQCPPPHLGLWRGTCPRPLCTVRACPQSTKGFGALLCLRVPMHAMRLSVHCTVYSTVYLITHPMIIITDEDNNENANELMTRESFDCQNGHYKITGLCENTPFHLLSSYCRAIIQCQFKSLTNFEIGVGGAREIRGWGHCPLPPLATALEYLWNLLESKMAAVTWTW